MRIKREIVYTPRWLYRFFAFLERLPIPLWALGLSIILIGGLAMHLDAWRQGLVPAGQFNRYLATVSLWNVGYPAVWIYLDRRARVALREFFRNQRKSKSELETILADFISIPSIIASLLFLFGMFFGVLYLPDAINFQPLIGRVLPIWDYFSWIPITGLVFMLLYRTLRQAYLIPRLFQQIDVDIFNPEPVYVLSRYGAQAAVILFLVSYALLYSSLPDILFAPAGLVYNLLITGTSLIYFFAPLASINRHMRRQKEKLLGLISEDQKAINTRLHISVNSKKFAELSDLRTAVSALKDQHEVVQKLPTWPWQSDTLRNLLTPLLIPVLVYLMSRFLGSMFGI
ncbi:MAG TPA: hypothetical protein VJ182_02495 [Anaerolineales bacterium]|nr:hypothetical protein [Anaerolineales bacterium]